MLRRNDSCWYPAMFCGFVALAVPIGAALLSNKGISFSNNVYCCIPLGFGLLGGFIWWIRSMKNDGPDNLF